MSETRSSTDEKHAIVHETPTRQGFFAHKKNLRQPDHHKVADPEGMSSTGISVDSEPLEAAVSIAQLFRFSTRFELCIDAIGLLAAAAAGAAQPLMTLLFGNLTQQFVQFGQTLLRAQEGDAAAQEQLPVAAAAFRHAAAKDAGYLAVIGLGMFVCTYTYMLIWVYTGEVNAKRIRERYLEAVLRQDIQFFDKVGSGEVATRIQTDTHLVQQGMSEKVAIAVSYISSFITGFVVAYVRSWRLALALSSMLICIGITGVVIVRVIRKYRQSSLQHVADGGSLAEEIISTIRTAQAFGSQKVLSAIYDKLIYRSAKDDSKAAIWSGGGQSVFLFVLYGGYGLAFSFGTTLIRSHHATSGAVINVFMAILIGSLSLVLVNIETQAITEACGAAAKLYATIDRVPTIDSADPSGAKPDHVGGEITLEDVRFSYPSRPAVEVVKGLSITFKAGKTSALVGASGSGKSTIVSLVERFYDPDVGAVKIDGLDVKSLNLTWLRSQIGLVSQEPTLFGTSIKGNVAHGLINTPYEHATEEVKFALIKDACVKANADGFISKLPSGYDTMVGERGFLLSGGQKQRVAIARAIVSDPRILLLDEATSALDTQSEGIVQDALEKAAAGRTTITIAHRLSTIKDADTIFVMGEGLVLEQGTHEQLINKGGAYARLVSTQKIREEHHDGADDADTIASSDSAPNDVETAAREELPLGRRTTGHSLANEVLEKKRKEQEVKGDDDHSIPYLFKRMAVINRSQWSSYGIGFVCAIFAGMVYPAFGVVFAKGIDGFSQEGEALRRAGDRNALWFFLISIVATICAGLQNGLFSSSAAVLTAKLRSLSFKAIMRQDIEFFDRDEHTTGALTSDLSENAQKVNGLAGITLGAIVQCISTLVSGMILGLIFAWKVALVAMACTPFLVSAGYIRLRVVVLKDKQNKKAHEESAQLACEAAGSIRTVAALTREKDCCNQYGASLEEPLRKSNRSAIWSNALFATSQAISFLVIALVFWFGSILVSHQEYSVFRFFVGLMSTTFGAIQAGNVFSYVPDVSSAQGAGSSIIKLLDSLPEIDAESSAGKRLDASHQSKGHISLEHVHFRYPTRPDVRVLRDLTLQVNPGTYIALVGASGSGKSTVIQLIERFYDPLAGQIYLDGQLITELNIQDYRNEIALVSQEPTLYAGTVRFNIMLGAVKPQTDVTHEELEEACRKANILEFIESLPKGFDTEVGGKGSQLSGGQKQRIAIARALLRNPKVLLLDEATSALDSNSEKIVQEALDKAAKGRTTIAIAHRLSTIQNADRIYFIKEGRVSESGTHDQLLSKRGHYYEFVQLQALSKR